jgi:uncharacterized membrane protein
MTTDKVDDQASPPTPPRTWWSSAPRDVRIIIIIAVLVAPVVGALAAVAATTATRRTVLLGLAGVTVLLWVVALAVLRRHGPVPGRSPKAPAAKPTRAEAIRSAVASSIGGVLIVVVVTDLADAWPLVPKIGLFLVAASLTVLLTASIELVLGRRGRRGRRRATDPDPTPR